MTDYPLFSIISSILERGYLGAQQLKPKIVPGQNGPAHVNKATPISMLQELCQKLNKQPRYDLLTMEGRAHQPSFVFR